MKDKLKEDLLHDIEDWIDSAIYRLNKLKHAAVQIIQGDTINISVDSRTLSLLNMIVNLRESRLKGKKEVMELMDGLREERKRTVAEWNKTLEIMKEKRRELLR